jgi:cytochrome c biogenesis protein CcmG, thiol:disulfide interchange protein DsbE
VSAVATDADPSAGSDPGSEPSGGSHLARNASIVVGIVLVLLVVLLATRQPASETGGPNPLIGRAVPAVEGTALDGSTVDIDALRGKWVVVNFFATWCTPCILEHPELVRFSEEHAAAGDAEVISIAYETEPQALRDFFEKEGGTWPVLVGDDARLALDFGVTGVPESFVVSPAGQVVAHFTGVTADGLDQVIADVEAQISAQTAPGSAP